MIHRAPFDIAFSLKHAAGFGAALAEGLYGDLGEDVVDAMLAEVGRFATGGEPVQQCTMIGAWLGIHVG